MSEISDILHEQDLKAKKNALSPKDKENLKSSMTVDDANGYLMKQDTKITKKGVNLYKQNKLTPKIGAKLDKQTKINDYAEGFLLGVQDNVDEPTLGDGFDDPDDNAHYNHNRISKHALDNGSFQKNVIKGLKSYLGPHETMANDYAIQNYSASNIFKILDKASSKGFSKNVRDYLKATRQTPKKVDSFEELAKLSKPKFKVNPNRNAHKSLATKPIKKEKLNRNHGRNRNINRGPSMN